MLTGEFLIGADFFQFVSHLKCWQHILLCCDVQHRGKMYALQSLRFTLIRHLTCIWEGVGQECTVFQNAPAFNAGAPGVEGVWCSSTGAAFFQSPSALAQRDRFIDTDCVLVKDNSRIITVIILFDGHAPLIASHRSFGGTSAVKEVSVFV